MSRARAYKQETLDIQKRYFEAIQVLLDEGKLPGRLIGYLDTYGIDSRHWYAQRADNGRGYFEVSWLLPLIRYFRVSANWLLFGTGKMFKGQSSPTAENSTEPK